MELPFEVVEFVVVDVVVFVCPSLLLVVVAVYPPVICVLLPEVFVWSLSSFVESPYTGTLMQSMKANKNANSKVIFHHIAPCPSNINPLVLLLLLQELLFFLLLFVMLELHLEIIEEERHFDILELLQKQ